MTNEITIPMYEFDNAGELKSNPVFHRPFDKLHSRCIEYPFAASHIGDAKIILDVGTVKSDPMWISWLENLPIEVHVTDYDIPLKPFRKVTFHQADIRNLPMEDRTFDKVIAVSVIEHIGLHSPQVFADCVPDVDMNGDLEAVKELARVLKPGGELIMTFPFGKDEELILDDQARNYTSASIKKFDKILKPLTCCYYEYQYNNKYAIYQEYGHEPIHSTNILSKCIRKGISKISKNILLNRAIQPQENSDEAPNPPELPGVVTWRRLPLEQTNAKHIGHVEGVLCGVWKRDES